MSKRSDGALWLILNRESGDYTPEALEAAQAEWDRRGLTLEQAVQAVKAEYARRAAVAEANLKGHLVPGEPGLSGWLTRQIVLVIAIPAALLLGTLLIWLLQWLGWW